MPPLFFAGAMPRARGSMASAKKQSGGMAAAVKRRGATASLSWARRLLRGGSWDGLGHNCRSANRSSYAAPDDRNSNFGFRVSRTP
jgi:formylglycine-generating enzyme required for sulfatase activity